MLTMMKRNATDCHEFVRVVRHEIKVLSDWFGYIRPCHFFQRLEGVREIGHLASFLSHQCINVCVKCILCNK